MNGPPRKLSDYRSAVSPQLQAAPRSTEYQCTRCLGRARSQPVDKDGIYRLPKDWTFTPARGLTPERIHCWTCVVDIVNGSPVEL